MNASVGACCTALAAVNDEFQRRLIAANFQYEPSALALYGSPLCAAARWRLANACRDSPPAQDLVRRTSAKHWKMLRCQRGWHERPRALDQVLVWLCRDALAGCCGMQRHNDTAGYYDFMRSLNAAAAAAATAV